MKKMIEKKHSLLLFVLLLCFANVNAAHKSKSFKKGKKDRVRSLFKADERVVRNYCYIVGNTGLDCLPVGWVKCNNGICATFNPATLYSHNLWVEPSDFPAREIERMRRENVLKKWQEIFKILYFLEWMPSYKIKLFVFEKGTTYYEPYQFPTQEMEIAVQKRQCLAPQRLRFMGRRTTTSFFAYC